MTFLACVWILLFFDHLCCDDGVQDNSRKPKKSSQKPTLKTKSYTSNANSWKFEIMQNVLERP